MAITTWVAPFADGWYPRLSPDGAHLLCGSGVARVVHLATKQVLPVPRQFSSGWLNPSQAVVFGQESSTGPWGAWRVDAPAFATPVKIGPGANFHGTGGNLVAGGNTNTIWVSDANGNARTIAPGYAATCDETGMVAYSIDVHTSPKLVVWRNNQIVRTIVPAYPPNSHLVGAGGYVGYGYYGPSWLNDLTNTNQQVNLTRADGVVQPEGPPLAFRHAGAVWIATCNDHGVYLRPLGVRDKAIVISIPYHHPNGGAVGCSVVSMGAYILVASNDNKGKLRVDSVPADTAMTVVPAPPVEVTPPPVTKPPVPRATISSFDGEVTLPETAKAVAKVTQGKPTHFRWQYQDASTWKTQATNPASDLDHSYTFPKEGRYNIRLQTLDGTEVTDTTSSTARAVVVHPKPTTPPVEPPAGEDVPTYNTFVNAECPAVAAAVQDVWSMPPPPDTMGHNSWRRLAEGWTHAEVIAGIHDANLHGQGQGPWFGWVPVEYAHFVQVESVEVADAYVETFGPSRPTPADMGHTAWRRFAEFWTHRDIVHDVKGEPLEDGGMGGAKPPTPPARTGVVRAHGRHFMDEQGVFYPLGGTLFWALRGWKYERERLKANIAFLAKYHFDYMRILLQVGWQGNDISETWPDHVSLAQEVIDHAYSVGVRTQVTGVGGGDYNADVVMDHLIAAVRGREHKVIYNEVVNEWYGNWDGTESQMKAYGRKLKTSLPNLVALSAPREEMATDRSAEWVHGGYANMATCHLDRSDKTSEWKWRHVRKPWEPRNPSFPESHGEPGGPLSSVASFMEPIHLVMSRAVGILCGMDAYCLHNGAGVGGQVDPAHHRPANLWEVPGIDTIMQVVRGLDVLLPPGASDGVATRTGNSGHPLTCDEFWDSDADHHGVVRDYARRNGSSFWQCLQGVKNYVNVKADRAYHLTFIDPVTHSKHERDINGGQSLQVTRGSTDTRGLGAWIVLGTNR